MLITPSQPGVASLRASTLQKTDAGSVTLQNDPIDGWSPGSSEALANLAPYSLAVLAGAAGLAAGFAEGPAAMVGGALALGSAGAVGSVLMGAASEFSGGKPNYTASALLGGAVGAAAGVYAASVGGPVVGLLAAAVGGMAGYVGSGFLTN